MTIASDLLQRHFQTLVQDNSLWQTLIADDLVWELLFGEGQVTMDLGRRAVPSKNSSVATILRCAK